MSGSVWPQLASLPLHIEDYALERLEQQVSSGFLRISTHIRLGGGGHEGIGEDVSYEESDQVAQLDRGAVLPLAGEWTLESFCDHLATLDLWPQPPAHDASVLYRVWAYESAALDLALRQAGTSLHEHLGLTPQPVRFVVSLRLGDPPTLAPLRSRLDRYPALRFKLDVTNDWDEQLLDEVAALGVTDQIDFKGHYKGSIVDVEPDPEQYRRVLQRFPAVWYEDPHPVDEIMSLVPYDQVSYDAPIHSVADIEALPGGVPRMVNVKPSRLGGLRPLLHCYAWCAERGIGMYGGGQFELGVGRGHIQYLASLFHADAPNDVAPGGYNDPEPPDGLPDSPLPVAAHEQGFRWG